MELSAGKVPGGALDIGVDIRRAAKAIVDAHRNCPVGDPRRCDLYHDLIQTISDIAERVRENERALLICRHPAACLDEMGVCSWCRREREIIDAKGSLS